jgi:hypothetical protein
MPHPTSPAALLRAGFILLAGVVASWAAVIQPVLFSSS